MENADNIKREMEVTEETQEKKAVKDAGEKVKRTWKKVAEDTAKAKEDIGKVFEDLEELTIDSVEYLKKGSEEMTKNKTYLILGAAVGCVALFMIYYFIF